MASPGHFTTEDSHSLPVEYDTGYTTGLVNSSLVCPRVGVDVVVKVKFSLEWAMKAQRASVEV